jgi:mycothiol synthase
VRANAAPHIITLAAHQATTPASFSALPALAFGALERGELPGFTRHDLEVWLAGVPAKPEAVWLALDAAGAVVGCYAPSYPLLIVAPDARRQGHGRRLVEAELARARAQGAAQIELAPPRGSVVARDFCAALGFAYRSSLWQLVLEPAVVVPPPDFPADIVTRQLRPGADDEAFVPLFNAAFAEHEPPLQVTLEQVRNVHARADFDPGLLLLLAPADAPEQLIGFGRASLVPQADGGLHGHVEALGVLSEWRGHGLGRELLRWAVATLRARGATTLDLHVEARNPRALALYERAGFTRGQEWPRWARAVGS